MDDMATLTSNSKAILVGQASGPGQSCSAHMSKHRKTHQSHSSELIEVCSVDATLTSR